MKTFVSGGEHHEEIPTLSARIEEKQKRVDIRSKCHMYFGIFPMPINYNKAKSLLDAK